MSVLKQYVCIISNFYRLPINLSFFFFLLKVAFAIYLMIYAIFLLVFSFITRSHKFYIFRGKYYFIWLLCNWNFFSRYETSNQSSRIVIWQLVCYFVRCCIRIAWSLVLIIISILSKKFTSLLSPTNRYRNHKI